MVCSAGMVAVHPTVLILRRLQVQPSRLFECLLRRSWRDGSAMAPNNLVLLFQSLFCLHPTSLWLFIAVSAIFSYLVLPYICVHTNFPPRSNHLRNGRGVSGNTNLFLNIEPLETVSKHPPTPFYVSFYFLPRALCCTLWYTTYFHDFAKFSREALRYVHFCIAIARTFFVLYRRETIAS